MSIYILRTHYIRSRYGNSFVDEMNVEDENEFVAEEGQWYDPANI